MSIKITYFVHGTTVDNENIICTGWNQGELSERGIRQSKELHSLVKDKEFDLVFSSDLKRAVDSAELYFNGLYKIIQDRRLREANYGELNGFPESSFNSDHTIYINSPFPNGESYKDVEKRMASFLNYLSENYEDKHIAIVAHRAPQLALDVLVKCKTWEEAINEDWRKTKAWQPGWEYIIDIKYKSIKSEQYSKESRD